MSAFEREEDEIYMLVQDGDEWEDISVILKKEDAIAASIKYQKSRKANNFGYTPSYNYYKNGTLVIGS